MCSSASLELRLSGQSGDLMLSKGYLKESEAEVRPAGSAEGAWVSLEASLTQWHLGPRTSGHFSSLMLMAVQTESRCDDVTCRAATAISQQHTSPLPQCPTFTSALGGHAATEVACNDRPASLSFGVTHSSALLLEG